MSKARIPRVLVLTHNRIQSYTGGGVLLGNLFHKIPRSNIFFLHTDDGYGDGKECREHRLSLRSLRPQWIILLRLLSNYCFQVIRTLSLVTRSDLIALVLQGCRYSLLKQVDAEIRKFSPDVIYAWVGDSLWAKLLLDCAERYRIPYVIHFMDNHVELNGGTVSQRILHSEYRRNLFSVVNGASRIFTISAAMGAAYHQKFGKRYDVFHGLIDKMSWPWPEAKPFDDIFSLVFTGSIENGQVIGLLDVAAAVERLAAEGNRVQLVLYLTEYYESRARKVFGNYRHVRYEPHPEFANLRSVLNNADLLVLAYGFDEPSIQYYRYSFATKVVPYMLSGRCILAYGPAVIEPIGYLSRGGWGHIVSQPGAENLAESIKELMLNQKMREEYAWSAYNAGLAEHDLEENSARFMAVLCDVAHLGVGCIRQT